MITFKLFPRRGQPEKEDGYTIAKATHEGTGEEIVLKGRYGPVTEGQLIQIERYAWRQDTRYGAYVQVFKVSHQDPMTREAVVHYLEHLPGVGPKMADAIVEELGIDCLSKIDRNPELLTQIKVSGRGIKRDDLQEVVDKWEELRAERKALIYLSSLGLGDATARKIIRHYGLKTNEVVAADPYQMTKVDGVGFRIADKVAEKLGIGPLDPRRTAAGVGYVLESAESDGHICLTREELIKRAPRILTRNGKRPSAQQINKVIDDLVSEGELWSEVYDKDGVERIYTTEHYIIETRLYDLLHKRLIAPGAEERPDLKRPKDSPVTDEQWEAVEKAFVEKLSILTGGPGTGKTTALKELLDQLDAQGAEYVCLAPTGKAAKRMEESTGRSASTIHRFLGFEALRRPSSFRGQVATEDRVKASVVIVDEASMLDMRLAERLLSHLRDDTNLVLVGDPDQLPAVGAGSVLHDLIESGRVPTTRLTQVFRQAEQSLLVVNAHRIKNGEEPFWSKEEAEQALGHEVREDWKFIEVDTDDPREAARQAIGTTLKLIDELPAEMGIDADEVMVMAPSKQGSAGTYVLNQAIQRKRNPSGEQFRDGDQPLRVGDIVMNTKNRYNLGTNQYGEKIPDVMNGDMGKVVSYDPKTRTAWIDFGLGTNVPFSGDQMEALIGGYCSTVHKMQGSEAPAVITPIVDGKNSPLMSRNLIYTAQTRAKEKCVVVGSKDIVREALKRDGTRRNTTLDLRVERIAPRLKARWERVAKLRVESVDEILYG